MQRANKPLLMRLLVVFLFVLVALGLWFWNTYEHNKAQDIITLSTASQLQTALDMYYRDHGAYPYASNLLWPSEKGNCLSKDGFVSMSDDSCKSYAYLKASRYDTPQVYTPLQNGQPCQSMAGCESYQIPMRLRTSTFSTTGSHVITPQGIQ